MIAAKVQELTDVELAILLCLVANQHCIIETEGDALDALQEELQLVGQLPTFYICNGLRHVYQVTANAFGLSAVVVKCSSSTTFEDFSSGVLIPKRSSNGGEFAKVGITYIGIESLPLSTLSLSSLWTIPIKSLSSLFAIPTKLPANLQAFSMVAKTLLLQSK